MGYVSGIQWNDELIAKEILKIANQFEPPRMPSAKETKEMYGGYALSVAIGKHGGYKHWADRLGLKQKKSDTKLGLMGEEHIAKELSKRGYAVEMTSTKHPYDILVDGCVKIDVKTANESFVRGCSIHSYRLAKRVHTCDFYIFYEADTGKIYVVPAHKCFGQVQVGMSSNSKPYAKYLNAFDLIKQASIMYQEM